MSAHPDATTDLVTRTQAFLTDLDTERRDDARSGLDDHVALDASGQDEAHTDDGYGDDGYGDDEFTDLDGSSSDHPSPASADPDDEFGDAEAAGADPDDEFGDAEAAGADPDGDYEIESDEGDEATDGYSTPAETTAFLEPTPEPEPDADDRSDQTASVPARFSKPVVIGFVALTAVVAIGLSAAMLAMRPNTTVVSDQPSALAPQVAVVSAPPAPSGAAPDPNSGADAPIPFTASADCPLGSTAAQAVAGTDRTRAWVCVRAGADGQVLTLDLGRPMKITAITIVPGWVGADTSGADQWLQHRVVTRVQWILINGDQRIAVPQNTNNVHGEAVQQMPGNGPDRGVLASQIQMIVQQTSRAPADTPTPNAAPGSPSAPDQNGGLPDVLGGPIGAPPDPSASTPMAPLGGTDSDSANADPADNTFAVSSIKVIGHLPQ